MYSEGKVFSTSKASPQSITKSVGFGNSISPGVIDIRLPAKPEVTPRICSDADSRLRRFTLPEGRNLHLEVVRFLLSCWHQQYQRNGDGAVGAGTGRAGSEARVVERFDASAAVGVAQGGAGPQVRR